jgi:hypothetical protein
VALGMGEKEDDLYMFNAKDYSNALMINWVNLLDFLISEAYKKNIYK